MNNFKFAVFDIEAEYKWVKFLCLGFYDGQEYRLFKSMKSFFDFICKTNKYNGYRIYAHYGGKYDFLFLMEEIRRRDLEVKILPRQGSMLMITLKVRHNLTINFADSFALLPAKLSELTKTFKVPHRKKEHKFIPGKRQRMTKRFLEYTRFDVLGLYEVLQSFASTEFVQGKPQLTIASQSLRVFRDRFLGEHELVRLENEDEDEIRKNYYAGGRVEVYKGFAPQGVRVYDVNSLYPFAMLKDMPSGVPCRTSVYNPRKIGFYHINVLEIDNFYCSPLLFKKWKSDTYAKNYFLNGRGFYYLSSYTIQLLQRVCKKFRFRTLDGWVFPSSEPLFADFVNTFYTIRREHKGDALSYIAKLFLNSLYGKLGQTRWKEVITHWNRDLENFVTFDEIYGLMLVLEETKSKFVLPYLAAYITDVARAIHWEYMQKCGDQLYYADTDSIFTTSKVLDKYVGTELGKLKLEGVWKEGIFLAPKTYALRDGREQKVVFKGFDPKKFTFHDFERALHGSKVLSMDRERVLSFTECTRIEEMKRKSKGEKTKQSRVQIDYEQGYYLKVSTTTKEMQSEYDRRAVTPSKRFVFDTMPFERKEFQ